MDILACGFIKAARSELQPKCFRAFIAMETDDSAEIGFALTNALCLFIKAKMGRHCCFELMSHCSNTGETFRNQKLCYDCRTQ